MRRSILLLSAASMAACGHSGDQADNNAASANAAAAEAPKPAYCFFKPSETKGWKASRGRDGNVVVKGSAWREDSRYQAVLGPPKVSGSTAEVSPTIQQNATRFAAPDNWWPIDTIIPNSTAVATVKVTCGEDTIASLSVPAAK